MKPKTVTLAFILFVIKSAMYFIVAKSDVAPSSRKLHDYCSQAKVKPVISKISFNR